MYSFSTEITEDFDTAIEKVTDSLKREGFGVLTTIDVQATMKAKLDVEGKPYTILGACNPSLAHQALETEADIGLLLPCNVVVRENDKSAITVSFMDPEAVLNLVDHHEIKQLSSDVKTRLERVCNSL